MNQQVFVATLSPQLRENIVQAQLFCVSPKAKSEGENADEEKRHAQSFHTVTVSPPSQVAVPSVIRSHRGWTSCGDRLGREDFFLLPLGGCHDDFVARRRWLSVQRHPRWAGGSWQDSPVPPDPLRLYSRRASLADGAVREWTGEGCVLYEDQGRGGHGEFLLAVNLKNGKLAS